MSGILLASVGNSYGSLPVNTVAPVVSGSATTGSTLTTTDGTWEGAPAPTFSYQWQRDGSNISGATSSTYVLVNADAGSTVRCVVTATNPLGSVSANSNSTATVTIALGQAYEGGFFAGQINDGGTIYNLVVAPKSSGEDDSKKWKTSNSSTSGTASTTDGPSNTSAMNNSSHPAAFFCAGLSIGGYSDWYMPAQDELEILYYNFKPTTSSNSTSSGTNTNAVPPRNSDYTSGDPAQTSVTDFQAGNTEAFNAANYWSSTQSSSTNAWRQFFDSGVQLNNLSKTSSFDVRAVRRVEA